jgi:hypothetical protein
MSSRKGEITARVIERDYPHIVELPLPSGGFRAKSEDILTFHRERAIPPRRHARVSLMFNSLSSWAIRTSSARAKQH